MTQSKEICNLKRIKYLFGVFLKQFQVDEYKLLMQFLQLSINRYNADNILDVFDSGIVKSGQQKRKLNNQQIGSRPKIGKIEQTINMLKNRTEMATEVDFNESSDESDISNILLDDEELTLINSLENLVTDLNHPYDENTYEREFVDSVGAGADAGEDFQYNDEFNETMSYNNTPVKVYAHHKTTTNNTPNVTTQLQNNCTEDYDDSEYVSYDTCLKSDYNNISGELTDDYANDDYGDVSVSHINNAGLILKGLLTNPVAVSKLQQGNEEMGECMNGSSPRKFIRKFNDEVRHELELKFVENNFISGVEKDRLAIRLNLTERQVKKWFEKRREKKRRIEKMGGVGSWNGSSPGGRKTPKALQTPKVSSAKQIKAEKQQFDQQDVVSGNGNHNDNNSTCQQYSSIIDHGNEVDNKYDILGDGDDEMVINNGNSEQLYNDNHLDENNCNNNYKVLKTPKLTAKQSKAEKQQQEIVDRIDKAYLDLVNRNGNQTCQQYSSINDHGNEIDNKYDILGDGDDEIVIKNNSDMYDVNHRNNYELDKFCEDQNGMEAGMV